jgi:hypothetical protein
MLMLAGIKGGELNSSSFNRILFQEVFGIKFYNFCNHQDSYVKRRDTATQYEGMSKEESEKMILSETDHLVKFIAKQGYNVERLKEMIEDKYATKDEFINFMKVSGVPSYGFHFMEYRKRHIFQQDIANVEMAKKYATRYIRIYEDELLKEKVEKIEEAKTKYREREEDWDWAFGSSKGEATDGNTKERAEITVNKYPPLSYIKRTGGYEITEDNITPTIIKKGDKEFAEYEVMQKHFGFKEVEIGKSMADKFTKEHIRHFLGAMADLGDILDIDIASLNRRGGLSIAFASRGKGKASAHYEATRKIMNFTKTRGGGAVAHEYMHFIDNLIPSMGRSMEYDASKDWASVQLRTSKKLSWGNQVYRKIEQYNVHKAFDQLMTYIKTGSLPFFEKDIKWPEGVTGKGKVKKIIKASDKSFSLPVSFYESGRNVKPENIDDYLKSFFNRYANLEYIEDLNKRNTEILGSIIRKFGFPEYEIEFKSNTTQFYASSISMSSDYWSRDWELVARSFECYVYDKLAKANRVNNYLVSGAYFDSPYGVYPSGVEREVLFIIYENLFEVIKKEYELSGFVSWTESRVDEYFALSEEKDGEDDEVGVVIDKADGSVVMKKGDNSKMLEKLNHFLELLTENKPQTKQNIKNLYNIVLVMCKEQESHVAGKGGRAFFDNNEVVSIGKHKNIIPLFAQVGSDYIVKIAFSGATGESSIIFSNLYKEESNNRSSLNKDGGYEHIHEPLTEEIAGELIEKIAMFRDSEFKDKFETGGVLMQENNFEKLSKIIINL